MSNGKRETAQNQILLMLRQYGRLNVADVVNVLHTSEATVRRHFADMADKGLLIRTYGGVCIASAATETEYLFQHEAAVHIPEKRAIGQAAAALIRDRDRLFFDSGTTVRECGNVLAERISQEELADIAIVTNSLVYNESLARECPMNLIGGTIRMARMDLCGMSAIAALGQYNFTKAILGVDGISENGELTTTDEGTSLLAQAVVEHSREVLILADSSKLGNIAFASYGNLHNGNFTLITDRAANPAFLKKLSAQGIRILIAETK